MAFHIDPNNGDIIIDGFQNGVGDSPYSGLTDLRNINIISVPGEGSINFSTQLVTPSQTITAGTVSSANSGNNTITFTGAPGLANGMAVTFSASTISGVSTNTIYWINGLTGGPTTFTASLYTDYDPPDSIVTISGTGTGTFSIVKVNQPHYFARESGGGTDLTTWCIDALGQVWSNLGTPGGTWVYTGNKVPDSNHTAGNGLLFYEASDGTGYLFVFHNSSIDVASSTTGYETWNYQWDPVAGSFGSYSATPTRVLKTPSALSYSHEAFVAPDSKAYFCDLNWVGEFFQLVPTTPFDPSNNATYVFSETELLPVTEWGNCINFLGTNILVGANTNKIYVWDAFDTTFSYIILLAENFVAKMVTVNTNTYIFVGNRGRIYLTNGSQATLYKKMPDHVSGTIEPYYQWGGATFNKNQLYFSALVTTNGGTANTNYGGLWAINLDNGAIRLTNKLSYGTYAGFASAIISNIGLPQVFNPFSTITNPPGSGLFIGWDNGSSNYGIDGTVSTLYQSGESVIISDMLPIGTAVQPTTPLQFEYKLSTPLIAGETIALQVASSLNGSFTTIGTTSTAVLSEIFPNTTQEFQWLLVKTILTAGTSATPTYNRLTQIRVKGATLQGSPMTVYNQQ